MGRKRKATEQEQATTSAPEQSDTGKRKVIVPKRSAASAAMREESHAWLKWPGCNNNRKIELNNKLAEMQNRPICPPRFLDREVIEKLGIRNQLKEYFTTRFEDRSRVLEIEIWEKALNVAEEVYREFCLEFYSSLRVDKKFKPHEFYSKKLIHFRLGGKEHSTSITEFGYLSGLLTEEEARHHLISDYMLAGKRNPREFLPEADPAWLALTGIAKHTSSSKVSAVRVPILRLIHKLVVYSFTHRPTQHDKCYFDDLWLIDCFFKRDPTVFVCVPWVLVTFMETKAAGKRADSQICCGHFITRIMKNLNLFTTANIRTCAKPVNFKRVTMHDLEVMRLLKPDHKSLIDETVGESSVAQERPPKKRRTNLIDEIRKLSEGVADLKKSNKRLEKLGRKTDRRIECLSNRFEYHIERYRDELEILAEARADAAGMTLSPYAPPPPFAPRSEDETSDEEEVEREGEEAESESGDDESETEAEEAEESESDD